MFVWILFLEQAWFKWKYNALIVKENCHVECNCCHQGDTEVNCPLSFPVILNSLLVTNVFVGLLRSEETYLKHHILANIL